MLAIMSYGTCGEDYVICEGCDKDKPPNNDRAINKKIACRTHSWKYICNEDGGEELYNLSLDREEKSNLWDQETNVAEDLKQKITKHLEMEEKAAARIKEKRRIKEKIKNQYLNLAKR